ncbi:hypothetical protein CORT_0E04900 [Candida orthopsilosis Co 90-125]|uniref:Uncharacterized protein n=1 Tax=Candida orthopsilosis (strain 90-125) TaxID=1136231 RepID=H8X7X5_CANO9|nr:hypothetical protein CORT_0E04900 [Candida orthopsilosis Co 90-125]CCG24074.1 hypothetical protein CORT_0E04900 [Candida orthopsilosis Co 90-125]
MVSFHGLQVLASLIFESLWLIITFPVSGGINERYRNNLTQSLKVLFCRKSLAFPILDAKIVSAYSNSFLFSVTAWQFPRVTQGLNNYNVRYDKNSIWIVEAKNRSKDDPIIIYLHGGGYYCQTAPTQAQSLLAIYSLVEPSKREKLSVLFLDYSLASYGNELLTQLHELTATYTRLAKEGNTDFRFIGDSAGGHLSTTFTQYLYKEQNPELPYPRSLILVSPWVKLGADKIQHTEGHSYYDNEARDVVQYSFFSEPDRGALLVGDNNVQTLVVSPGNTPDKKNSDWARIPTYSKPGYSVFVVLGEHESFLDDILEFSEYALRSPLKRPSESGGVYDPKKHSWTNGGGSNEAYFEVFIEPQGVHDAGLFLENAVLSEIEDNPNLKVSQINDKEYFGIKRIVEFLDKTL